MKTEIRLVRKVRPRNFPESLETPDEGARAGTPLGRKTLPARMEQAIYFDKKLLSRENFRAIQVEATPG
jgi:hypothetical protein